MNYHGPDEEKEWSVDELVNIIDTPKVSNTN